MSQPETTTGGKLTETGQSSRRRYSDAELRRAVLDAAQAIVAQRGGLGVNLDGLGLEEVIAAADVPRSSAYRIWPSKHDFARDLLCDLAGPSWQGTAAFDDETIHLATTVVADHLDWLTTAEGRQRLLREAVRQGAKRNFDALVCSPQWRTYVALTATVVSMDEADEVRQQVEHSLREAEKVFIERMVDFYRNMSTVLGFRLRPPYGDDFSILAAVGASIVEGLGLRYILAPDLVTRPITLPGPDGAEEWSLPAVGFMGIVNELTEPEPEYEFTAALATYMKRTAAG